MAATRTRPSSAWTAPRSATLPLRRRLGRALSASPTRTCSRARSSSGGFTSKYGGAMSGVFDIETQESDEPQDRRARWRTVVGTNADHVVARARQVELPGERRSHEHVAAHAALFGSNYEAAADELQLPRSCCGAIPARRLSVFDPARPEELAQKAEHAPQHHRQCAASTVARNHSSRLHAQDVIAGKVAVKANLTTQACPTGRSRASRERCTEHVHQAFLDGVGRVRATKCVRRFMAQPRSRIKRRRGGDSTGTFASGALARRWGLTRPPGKRARPARGDSLRVAAHCTRPSACGITRHGRMVTDPRAASPGVMKLLQTLAFAAGRYHRSPRWTG